MGVQLTEFGWCNTQVGDLKLQRTYNPQQALAAHSAGLSVFPTFKVAASVAKTLSGEADDQINAALAIFQRIGPDVLGYWHEPENDGVAPADYVAIQRKVREMAKAVLPDVLWATVLMGGTYARGEAEPFYPGFGLVGSDGYNWCPEEHPGAQWRSAETILGPARQFAKDRGKGFVVAEFGCWDDPRRPQWLADAADWLESVRAKKACYFNRTSTVGVCDWTLDAKSEAAFLSAIGAVG